MIAQLTSLSGAVGAHVDALRKIYGAGRPADPAELGDAPRGRLLAFGQSASVYMLTRPLMRALATDHFPWKGKVFDHGGNSGQNVLLGSHSFRFRAEVGPSELDGRPTLVLTYDHPSHENPWFLRSVRDELRTVGPGIAIGPALLMAGGPKTLLWFGLEAGRAD